jgi:hypothetical protein
MVIMVIMVNIEELSCFDSLIYYWTGLWRPFIVMCMIFTLIVAGDDG